MQGNLAAKSFKALLLFEFIGTMFLTILYRIFLMSNSRIPFFFAFWVVTLLTIRVSGAHYNPAISFICMIKKDN